MADHSHTTDEDLTDEQKLAYLRRNTSSELDTSVLASFLQFNNSILRTNFYKSRKAALAFQLDPSCLSEIAFPKRPFGLFYVIGAGNVALCHRLCPDNGQSSVVFISASATSLVVAFASYDQHMLRHLPTTSRACLMNATTWPTHSSARTKTFPKVDPRVSSC